VTHELKTPISTVSVALEALSDFDVIKDKDKTVEYLHISRNEISRLKMLVDKVLKMSIFEKGAVKMQLEVFALDQLVEEVVGNMKVQFEKDGVVLSLEKLGDDFEIEWDRVHLTNVVYNLLDNAVKYCPTDPRIALTLDATGDDIILSVKDNGIGISEADSNKIFDRFYRVPSGDRHDVKGHGLGLSYVDSVLKQHGAKIELESQLGSGSTFIVTLKRRYVSG
jgi:two-component system phosphate regulon sensor histidine kinase PhoR